MKSAFVLSTGYAILAAAVACASTPTAFNPDNLADASLTRITRICQTVMGLTPKERLTGGEWRSGGNRLDYWTNHYRGCVTSLSDTLRKTMDDRATQQADHDCRANGYSSETADLALCVLNSKTVPDVSKGAAPAVNVSLPVAAGSFLYARPDESRRRELAACASLGIEPGHVEFSDCVRNLDETFYAIDNPIT